MSPSGQWFKNETSVRIYEQALLALGRIHSFEYQNGNLIIEQGGAARHNRPHLEAGMALSKLDRTQIFPEKALPDAQALIAEGRKMAETIKVGRSPFLATYGVGSEAEYKRQRVAENHIMMHAQIGFRDADKSRRAFAEIWKAIDKEGHRIDRYGICLDWSMGYPRAHRRTMQRGTGLILAEPEDWIAMTSMAPVAPHFGDFVIGTPAAFENTIAALLAGSTSVGNLGQYFAFRQPHWDDDVFTTAESL